MDSVDEAYKYNRKDKPKQNIIYIKTNDAPPRWEMDGGYRLTDSAGNKT